MSLQVEQPSKNEFPRSVFIFGCGYVGTALAGELMRRGVRVGALTRNAEKADHLRGIGVSEVIVADLDQEEWQQRMGGSYEAVVNSVSSAGGGLEGYRRSYVEGQKRILEWAQGRNLRSYVYTSSTSVYPQDGGVLVNEEADTSAAPSTGKVLLESEQLLREVRVGLKKHYILRLAGIYGPERCYLLKQLVSGGGKIPGHGDYMMNMIHRDDAVGAMILALSGVGASGIYNICDDDPQLKENVLSYLAEQLQMLPPVFDPENVSPRLMRRGGRMPNRVISNHKAREVLKWGPKYPSFREGYVTLLEKYRC